MKKIILAVMMLAPVGLAAQDSSFDRFLNKYDGKKGYACVNLQGVVLESMVDAATQKDAMYMLESLVGSISDMLDSGNDYPEYDWDDDIVIEEVEPADGIALNAVEMPEDDYEVFDVTETPEITEYDYIYDDTDEGYSVSYDDTYIDPRRQAYMEAIKEFLKRMDSFQCVVSEKPVKKFKRDIGKTVRRGNYDTLMSLNVKGADMGLFYKGDPHNENIIRVILVSVIVDDVMVAANITGDFDYSEISKNMYSRE